MCEMIRFLRILMMLSVFIKNDKSEAEIYNISSDQAENYCFKPACIYAADDILQAMDKSVDPCDDFYKFACGNFIKESFIPEYTSAINRRQVMNKTNENRLKHLIEEKIDSKAIRPFLLIKKLYDTCKDTENIDEQGLKRMKGLLKGFGDAPVFEGNNCTKDKFDWKTVAYKMRTAGFDSNFFIKLSVEIDDKNAKKRRLKIDQPTLGLSRPYLIDGLKNKAVIAYHNYMVEVLAKFGASKSSKDDLLEVVKFEIELAKIVVQDGDDRDVEYYYNLMTVKKLQAKYPDVPWLEYINSLITPYIEIKENEKVLVYCLNYLDKLFSLLRNTPKGVLANFIMWRAITFAKPYLPPAIAKMQGRVSAQTDGITGGTPRWKQCLKASSINFQAAISSLYVRNYFGAEDKKAAEELVSNLCKRFRTIIEKNKWMDEETKKKALEKAKKTLAIVGYHEDLLDDKKLSNYYRGLELDGKDYLEYGINISKFYYEKNLKSLRKPVYRNDWTLHDTAYMINAFEVNELNSIEFPAGNLQGIFFSSDFPKYINYGAAGRMIGHEMTHGFDDIGRYYDKDGNLRSWWTNKSSETYKQKAKYVVKLYSSYVAEEVNMHLNGSRTLGENIADLGGIKIAYLAYEGWLKKYKKEPQLPALNYTERQMFWIATANVWCTKMRRQSLKRQIWNNVHSPPEFRVKGMVSNTRQFARDFNCKLGSKMNPEKKYGIW